MKEIPDGSVDMILCDLPYQVTKNSWDSLLPFPPLWAQYERIIKPNGAIVLTAQDKFTAKLILSNEKMHRYNLIWSKSRSTGFLNANRMPLRAHEDICVFYRQLPTYNPQFTQGKPNHVKEGGLSNNKVNNNYGDFGQVVLKKTTRKHPKSVIEVGAINPAELVHPTQKPVPLMEWLIKTYTNEGDTVLDNCMGSGSTGVGCINTTRHFIGIEKDPHYFEVASQRIEKARNTAPQLQLL
jgi:site-specific DNA-methyltransferase (adenine-specific)